jgi:hypothetical protein
MTTELSFPRLKIALLFGVVAAAACLMPVQADTFWHLRAGQELWQTWHVPLDEHYSFTAAGRPWPNHEWLWQAVSYALVRAGGMPLLIATNAVMVVAGLAMAYRLMIGPASLRFPLLVVGIPLVSWVWAARPQVASLLLLLLVLSALVHERYRWLPFLFALWANTHGAVALGGAVLAAATLAAFLRSGTADEEARRRARALALALPACALATAATPMGFSLWRFIAVSTTYSRHMRIIEWMPAYPTSVPHVAFWLIALAFVALVVWRRHRLSTAPWGDVALVAAALIMLPLAILAGRNIPPFLMAAMPAASRLLGADFSGPLFRAPSPGTPDRPRVNLAILAIVTLAEVATVAVAWATSAPRLGWHPMSAAAIAAVRACPGRVYNRYGDGGYLIWFVPERPVFVDSRQDPYPLPFLLEQQAVEDGSAYASMFARYDIRCAFLGRDATMAERLRADGWTTRYGDERWAVLVKP